MFTFSFGSAFADISSDKVTELKTFTTTFAQGYYGDNGVIAKAAQAYLNKITYDEDGYVFNMNEIKGYVKADTIKAYMTDVVDKAEKTFSGKVANIVDSITVDGSITTNALAQAAVETAYNETFKAMFTELTGDPTGNDPFVAAVVQDLVEEQFKTEKVAADAVLAGINPANYSDSLKEYKIVAADLAGGLTANKLGVTAGKEYTAKGYVKAILDKQAADILAAETTVKGDADDAKAAVDAVRNAAKYAKEAILGHKIVDGENYYIEAVPTIEDLKADTSVETAKGNALAQIKASLASKNIEIAQALQAGIDKLSRYGKLSDSQKELLDKLNEQKADLTTNFANYEEFATANMGYKVTTAEVDAWKAAILGQVNNDFGTNEDGTYNAKTAGYFDTVARIVKNVKTLKADAELLKAQKDVNGKPYYDADVLAANLEAAIEFAYAGNSYVAAYAKLAGGTEAALIDSKIDYINFIKGTATEGFAPKDSKGYKVTTPWHKATDANTSVNIYFTTNIDGEAWEDGVDAMYDKAQKAELKALVADTKAAIESAKTIAEVEKIFAEANDKYNDIATTDDHQADWTNSGKILAAYKKADYDKELRAYAQYFYNKADEKVYNLETYNPDAIMSEVVYPVVYSAYTTDELAAKVAEAKAAIDAIKTKDQVKADKAAVEAAIKALPAASAITVADKDAITAAADLLDAYTDIPGTNATDITNKAVLDAAKKAYEAAAVKEIKAAYDALKLKDITTADADAVKALRGLYDAHADFCADYSVTSTLTTPSETQVKALEKALSDAKIAAAKELMIKLPANPTAKDKAQVEAARAAYEALTLEEKAQVVNTLAYKNLIDAEEALGLNVATSVKELKITARSSAKKGSITVKWTVKGDASAADGYQVWKSTKQSKGYKKAITTTKKSYKNTKGLKKGTRYYYKVRAYKVVDGKNVYSDWSNKAYRVAK